MIYDLTRALLYDYLSAGRATKLAFWDDGLVTRVPRDHTDARVVAYIGCRNLTEERAARAVEAEVGWLALIDRLEEKGLHVVVPRRRSRDLRFTAGPFRWPARDGVA